MTLTVKPSHHDSMQLSACTTSRADAARPLDTFARARVNSAGTWLAGALVTSALALPAAAASRATAAAVKSHSGDDGSAILIGSIFLGVAAGWTCSDKRFGWKVGLFSFFAMGTFLSLDSWMNMALKNRVC